MTNLDGTRGGQLGGRRAGGERARAHILFTHKSFFVRRVCAMPCICTSMYAYARRGRDVQNSKISAESFVYCETTIGTLQTSEHRASSLAAFSRSGDRAHMGSICRLRRRIGLSGDVEVSSGRASDIETRSVFFIYALHMAVVDSPSSRERRRVGKRGCVPTHGVRVIA